MPFSCSFFATQQRKSENDENTTSYPRCDDADKLYVFVFKSVTETNFLPLPNWYIIE